MPRAGLNRSLGREYESLSQLVYRRLRDQILWGAIAPGTRLSARALAEQLGVSSMPVRDALHRLATEELVEVQPRTATRVAPISLERVTEMFEVRTHLESLAGRLAVAHLTAADIARLKTYEERMERAGARSCAEGWHHWNQEFHLLLFRKCGNSLLQRMTQGLWDRNLRLFTARVVTQAAFRDRRSAEHRSIILALERRDPAGVEAAYHHHMVQSGIDTVAFLRKLIAETGRQLGSAAAEGRRSGNNKEDERDRFRKEHSTRAKEARGAVLSTSSPIQNASPRRA